MFLNKCRRFIKFLSEYRLYFISLFILYGCVQLPRMDSLTLSKELSGIENLKSAGITIPLQEYAWFYVPTKETLINQKQIKLTFHFHTAVAYAIREHLERGASNPLLVFNAGSGSRAYQFPFESTTLFSQLQKQALLECVNLGASKKAEISEIEISSFSAGYGAVREILKTPAYVRKISTVILTDSMYASYADQEKGIPVQEHIQPFVDFAKLACNGEKTFLITYSLVVPGAYASTAECAAAIVHQLGGEPAKINSSQSVEDGDRASYPMIARYDHQGLHVWGFAGDDANAHTAHVHSLAELWMPIEQ